MLLRAATNFNRSEFQKQNCPPCCDEYPINWIVTVKWISWPKWSSSLNVSQETNLISISTYPSVHTHFNRSAQNYSLAKSNQWITSATMPFPGYENDETKNLVDLEFVICYRVAEIINASSYVKLGLMIRLINAATEAFFLSFYLLLFDLWSSLK